MDRRLPRAEENSPAENTEVEENEEEQTTPVPLHIGTAAAERGSGAEGLDGIDLAGCALREKLQGET